MFESGVKLRLVEVPPSAAVTLNKVYECLSSAINKSGDPIVCIRNDKGEAIWIKASRFVLATDAGVSEPIKESHTCGCDLYTVLLRVGCKCGGK